MAHAACLVCLIKTASSLCKKPKNALEDVELVSGIQQNKQSIFFRYLWLSGITNLDSYALAPSVINGNLKNMFFYCASRKFYNYFLKKCLP